MSENTMRDAFEAHFKAEPYEWHNDMFKLNKDKNSQSFDCYLAYETGIAWTAWQAAIAHQNQEVADALEAAAKICESLTDTIVMRHPARIEYDPNSNMARKCACAIRALIK